MKVQKASWPERADKLAALLPVDQLHAEALAAALPERTSAGPWSVALSGGADSVALLLLLWAHWPARRKHLRALHYNHRLRGRAADLDEEHCRKLCAALGIKLWVGRRKDGEPVQNENQARELRFAFIRRKMQQCRSRVLWLGHQQDDVAETMLMRLARGSGSAGLAAPRPVHVQQGGSVHLRPLLTLKHGELTAAMRAAGIVWREDRSNRGRDYFRNRIRHDVLPVWVQAADRDAVAGAALSRSLLAEDDEALEAWAECLQRQMPARRLKLDLLAAAPRAVVRRLLYRWLGQGPAVVLSRQAFEQLLAAVIRGDSTRQSLGHHVFAVIRRGELFCEIRARGAKKRRD